MTRHILSTAAILSRYNGAIDVAPRLFLTSAASK